jgi:D-serine deaminase-like pyridoxal phosphate-dependent protein
MVTGSFIPSGLATPATLVFAERLDRNLASMAAFAADSGVALRPHAKTHKCPQIARRQIALGARGLSVATVGEAEILAGRGGAGQAGPEVRDIFIAYPLWPAGDLVTRLGELAERVRVTVGTDSAAAAGHLAPLAGRVRVMVEVDCGLGRSGVRPADAAHIARAAQQAGVEVGGVFTFPGHSYQPGAAAAAAADEAAALAEAAAGLAAAGFEGVERSGGSTPSARLALPGGLSELRPGVYALNDAQQVELGVVSMNEVALMVAATVVSRRYRDGSCSTPGPRCWGRTGRPGPAATGGSRTGRPPGSPGCGSITPWSPSTGTPPASASWSPSCPTMSVPPSTWSPNSWWPTRERSSTAGPSPPGPPTADPAGSTASPRRCQRLLMTFLR